MVMLQVRQTQRSITAKSHTRDHLTKYDVRRKLSKKSKHVFVHFNSGKRTEPSASWMQSGEQLVSRSNTLINKLEKNSIPNKWKNVSKLGMVCVIFHFYFTLTKHPHLK